MSELSGQPITFHEPDHGNKEAWLKLRTSRDLHTYQKFFGDSFGLSPELILDLGAGNSGATQQLSELQEAQATIIRGDLTYGIQAPPSKDSSFAVAADAYNLPFRDNTFDRVVSSWLVIHFCPSDGARIIREALRVVKPQHEVMLRPTKLLTAVKSSFAVKRRGGLIRSTLVITKPENFDDWDAQAAINMCSELARIVTLKTS